MSVEFPKPDFEAAKRAWLSGTDQGHWAWALGDLISMGAPILETFRVCAEAFPHPRLKLLNFEVHNTVREGGSMVDGLNVAGLLGALDPHLIDLVNIGEETGELDTMLHRYARWAIGGSPKTLAQALGRDQRLISFTEQLSMLQDAGLPLLRSLQMLADHPTLAGAKVALGKLQEQIEGGSSLSEAIASLGSPSLGSPSLGSPGLPVDPVLLAILRAGEVGGVLDLALVRLAQQNKALLP